VKQGTVYQAAVNTYEAVKSTLGTARSTGLFGAFEKLFNE